MTTGELSRRRFLETSSVGGAALALGLSAQAALGKDDEVVLGFIGTGGRGRFLLKQAADLPGIRFGAICDLKQPAMDEAMKILAEQPTKPKMYTDFKQMMEKEKLNGIMIATEVGNHAKVAVPVLEAGFNIFCEKPVDADVERVDKFVKAARAAKGITQIGFQRHYKPGYVEAIEKIHAGLVGDIRYLQGYWQWPRLPGGGWVADVAMSGGELVEQAGHHMDVMAWIMKGQHPERCVSMGGIMRKNPGASTCEDHSFTTFEFPNEILFQYSHLFGAGTRRFIGEMLRVYGSKAGAEINKLDYGRPGGWKAYDEGGKEMPITDKTCDHTEGVTRQILAFADGCRKTEKFLPASNIETARTATLMSIMGRQAMFNPSTKKFDERVIEWKDLGTTTDPA
ncbi:MAG: Gfo/Idh/MocA family oxidoreductase [Phycisphaerae bacterium]|nr:Gfo/Idh/MocA family oxidoreductase [Phycisphaerae bacterium]